MCGLFLDSFYVCTGTGRGDVWLSKPGGVLREAFMLVVYVMYVSVFVMWICVLWQGLVAESGFAVYCVHAPHRVRRCKFLCVCA